MIAVIALAALAATSPTPIGIWSATDARGTDTLALYADRGDCPAVARRAVYELRSAARVPGCYLVREGFVYILFSDGDRVRMPTRLLAWKRGHAPAEL